MNLQAGASAFEQIRTLAGKSFEVLFSGGLSIMTKHSISLNSVFGIKWVQLLGVRMLTSTASFGIFASTFSISKTEFG